MHSDSKRGSDCRGLWAIFWRAILVAPLLAPLGVAAFVVVLGLSWALPLAGVFWAFEGEYFYGALMMIGWGGWLRFGGPVRRWVFEGFEHGSI